MATAAGWQVNCCKMSQRPQGGAMKKRGSKRSAGTPSVVEFAYDNTDYQIDTLRRKVYRRWVEVESARTYLIMSAWSSQNAKKAI
jgi:hypothetical protein